MTDISSAAATRTGAQLLVDCLLAHGVDTAFCVPGESFLAVLDALGEVREQLRLIVGRHEASVCNMAEAYGKLTGTPGICFVTRGPGASQASVALHTASQDGTPLILFVGQVARDQLGREAFQEIDYRQMFGRTAKWVTEIVDANRIPELLGRAFHVAVNGRPGPVVISLPEDMQKDLAAAFVPTHYRRAAAAPSAEALEELQGLLEAAERPLLIPGGGGWSSEAVADITHFVEAFAIPVAAGFRRQDLFDNTHPNYVGFLGFGASPAVLDMVRRSDLLIAAGERLGDTTTNGYELIDIPRPRQKLVHVHPDPEELGMLYETRLPISASMRDFAAAASRLRPRQLQNRASWIGGGRQSYEKFSTPPDGSPHAIDVARIVADLARQLPPDAIISNGAGTYTGYVHRFYRYRRYGTQLAPASGSMGYGLPAAIAAKVVHPERPAVCFAGDGCFLMASQELATAMRHHLPIIVVVIDNASFGSIRAHQERQFPGRVYATDLVNPDFVALAKAYGAHAESVAATDAFGPAFERALQSGGPALIVVHLDIDKLLAFSPRNG